MASVTVLSMDGKEVETMELNDLIFDVRLNTTMVHQVALGYIDAKREGNAETKTRKEVRGGGRKPFRQKGTGNARQGSSREPQMRGGGTVFGPHKRSYRKKTPVRFKRTALRCMLSDRLRGDALNVLDNLDYETTKTKAFIEMLAKIDPEGRKTLFVTAGVNANVLQSASNLAKVTVRTASDVNAYDVLDAQKVFIVKDAVAALEERLS